MDLDQIMARLESDAAQHMTAGPSDDAELRDLETRIKRKLPAGLRSFLSRLGGGIYYQRHEIFGSRRVMIHDIEMVPDLVAMRSRLAETGDAPTQESVFPVHRGGGNLHLIELAEGDGFGRVVRADGGSEYEDFQSFLEAVVLQRG
jgi:hypothetical protein